MLIAAAMGVAGLLSLAGRALRRAPRGRRTRRPRLAAGRERRRARTGAARARPRALSAANYFAARPPPAQFVKTWDVQHSWLGSKYAPELGYFRIYECTLSSTRRLRARYRDVARISDLRRPLAPMPGRSRWRARTARRASRPSAAREFVRDLEFFQDAAGAPGERGLVRRQWLQPVAVLHGPHRAALPARGAELRLSARADAGRRRARAAALRARPARLRRAHDAVRGDLLLHQLLEPVRADGRLDPALRLSRAAARQRLPGAARAAARGRRRARRSRPCSRSFRRCMRSASPPRPPGAACARAGCPTGPCPSRAPTR